MSIDLRIVVYLLIPTSNHNQNRLSSICFLLYIFWFLHQTTTVCKGWLFASMLYIFWFLHQTTTYFLFFSYFLSCISFDSYIKPQLVDFRFLALGSCISFDSYIKPQLFVSRLFPAPCCISFDSYIKPQLLMFHVILKIVVYLLIPTSNHNPGGVAVDE